MRSHALIRTHRRTHRRTRRRTHRSTHKRINALTCASFLSLILQASTPKQKTRAPSFSTHKNEPFLVWVLYILEDSSDKKKDAPCVQGKETLNTLPYHLPWDITPLAYFCMHLLDVPLELLTPFLRPSSPSLYLRVTLDSTTRPPQWKAWEIWNQHPSRFDPVSNLPALERAFQEARLPFDPTSERHPQVNLAVCLDTLTCQVLDGFPPPQDLLVNSPRENTCPTVYWALALSNTNLALHGTGGMPHLVTMHEQSRESHVPDRILGPTHPDFWTLLESVEAALCHSSNHTLHSCQLGISAFHGTLSVHFGLSVSIAVVEKQWHNALDWTCRDTAAWSRRHTAELEKKCH